MRGVDTLCAYEFCALRCCVCVAGGPPALLCLLLPQAVSIPAGTRPFQQAAERCKLGLLACRVRHEAGEALGAIGTEECLAAVREHVQVRLLATIAAIPALLRVLCEAACVLW